MNVAPGATYEAVLEAGITGLVGTIKLGLYDNQGTATDALTTTGIAERPTGSGIYVATRTATTTGGAYTLVWSLDGTLSPEQVATEELIITASAPFDDFTGDTYASVEELARILKLRSPTDEQTTALERVLLAAAGEINSEIDLADDADALASWQLALAAEVNLERAAELWKQQEVQFNLVGLGSEFGPTHIARNTWEPYAFKLAPLKDQWGLA